MKVEVCCGSYADAMAAHRGGAERVELCGDLFFGGLTPSFGTFQLTRAIKGLEVAVMVRPREGGFCYNEAEFAVMLQDAQNFIDYGADAIVFGCLNADGTIQQEQTARLCALTKGKCDAVFHKAFDVCKEPPEVALDILKGLGITRILTSGKAATALEGAATIQALIDRARGSVDILVGGGVRLHNIAQLVEQTGCSQVHTSALEPMWDKSAHSECVFFTGKALPEQGQYSAVNRQRIWDFVQGIKELGL